MRAEEFTSLNSKHSPHLTTEQLGGLLDAELDGPLGPELRGATLHLEQCAECSAEVEELREALTLFRQSTSTYANRQLTAVTRERVHAARESSLSARPLWPKLTWVAAALLAACTVLPFRWHAQQISRTAATSVSNSTAVQKSESDAALLDDISRELSASVPEPMQALADPDRSGTYAYTVSTRTNQP